MDPVYQVPRKRIPLCIAHGNVTFGQLALLEVVIIGSNALYQFQLPLLTICHTQGGPKDHPLSGPNFHRRSA